MSCELDLATQKQTETDSLLNSLCFALSLFLSGSPKPAEWLNKEAGTLSAPKLTEPQAEGKRDTRLIILDAGYELIIDKGFNNTGLSEILKQAGVPKGSFYHYFKSKDDFGLQLLRHHRQQEVIYIESILNRDDVPPLQRLRQYIQSGQEKLAATEFKGGCLIGNMAQEMASLNEEFRELLGDIFTSWRRRLVAVLDEAVSIGDLARETPTEELVDLLLLLIEGAILKAKVVQSKQPLKLMETYFFDVVLTHPRFASTPQPT